jgi:hypothetical protein
MKQIPIENFPKYAENSEMHIIRPVKIIKLINRNEMLVEYQNKVYLLTSEEREPTYFEAISTKSDSDINKEGIGLIDNLAIFKDKVYLLNKKEAFYLKLKDDFK